MSVVREICDEVAVMDHGKIVEQGQVEKIMINPKHEVTNLLLKSLFEHDLPNNLVKMISQEPSGADDVIMRLVFSGNAASKPLISEVIQKYDMNVNIIAGGIDHFRETGFGSLTISAPYDKLKTDTIVKFFNQSNIKVDIVGFVPV